MTRSFVIVPHVPEILLYFFQSIFSLLFRLDDFSCSNQVHWFFFHLPCLFCCWSHLLSFFYQLFCVLVLNFYLHFPYIFYCFVKTFYLFIFFPGMFIIVNQGSFMAAVLKSLSNDNSNGYLVIVFSHLVWVLPGSWHKCVCFCFFFFWNLDSLETIL